jgi:AcrR family transcriptional regulator
VITKKKKGRVHHGDLPRSARAACLLLVQESGSAHITLRQIAAQLGATHVALYRHFANKEALLASVAEEGFRLLHEKIREATVGAEGETVTPIDQLQRIGAAYVRFARTHTAYFRLMYAREVRRTQHSGLRTAAAAAFVTLLDVVRECRKEGLIKTHSPSAPPGASLEVAMTAWSLVHGLAMLIVEGQFDDSGVDVDKLVEVAILTLRAGLTAQ